MKYSIVQTEFELPKPSLAEIPIFTKNDYEKRIERVLQRMKENRIDILIVYGDREHFANLYYLTGYDPRFEESLFILSSNGDNILLVGNEGWNYSDISPLKPKKVLYQTFSLQGQPRNCSESLTSILKKIGCNTKRSIGVVGTKYFDPNEISNHENKSDVPSYIIDEIRYLVGANNVKNVTSIFTDPETGLRSTLSVKEIAYLEAATNKAYACFKGMLDNLKLGITEAEVASATGYDGSVPLSYHIITSFKDNSQLGLASPTLWNKLEIGDYINIGFGIWGANIARAGMALRSSQDIPTEAQDIIEKFYIPYFMGICAWYHTLREGTTGGELYESVRFLIDDHRFAINLNPGHQLHFDEWPNSMIYKGSTKPILSGMALQCDIIASLGAPYYGVHVEDGVVIAGENLRQQLAKEYPAAYDRIMKRRIFMENKLGIKLDKSVLPMCDIQAVMFPYLLNTSIVFRCL